MAVQNKQKDVSPVNPVVNTIVARIREFTLKNLSLFFGSKFEMDRHDFLDNMHKVTNIIGITSLKCCLSCVSVVGSILSLVQAVKGGQGYRGWSFRVGGFATTFLDMFFQQELRKSKVQNFINLK